MAVAAAPMNDSPAVDRSETNSLWLRTRRWDLMYITFSVIVVPLPYLVYLLLRATNRLTRSGTTGRVTWSTPSSRRHRRPAHDVLFSAPASTITSRNAIRC